MDISLDTGVVIEPYFLVLHSVEVLALDFGVFTL